MTWAKLDDHFHDHAKVIAAGHEAVGLFALTLTWACGQQSEGKVPANVPQRFAGRRSNELCRRLVTAGLYEVVEGGWLIHDFLDYNPSRSTSAALSDSRAQAGRRGAAARWGNGKTAVVAIHTDGNTDGKLLANAQQKHAPARPVPSLQTLVQDVDFVHWWDAYPRHTAKAPAAKAYAAARKLASAEFLLAGALRYKNDRDRQESDPKFTAHAATWLNQGRWTDEPAKINGRPQSGQAGYDPHKEHLANW